MDRIDQLRAFVRVVEKGTFSEVAEELRVTQPTITKWLADLEEDLGVRLLHRTTRSRRLSEAGARFYERAKDVLFRFDDALAELKRDDGQLRGSLRINLPTVFGKRHLLRPLVRFAQVHDELELHFEFSDRYEDVVAEGFDLVVRVGPSTDSTLRAHLLGKAPRFLVASPAYLENHGTPQTPAELRERNCLIHGRTRAAVWNLSKNGHVQRIPVSSRVTASDSEATLELVRSGFGIARLGAFLVDDDLRKARLQRVLPDYRLQAAPIVGLTPPGPHLPRPTRALLDTLNQALANEPLCSRNQESTA